MIDLIRNIKGPDFLILYFIYCMIIMVGYKLIYTAMNRNSVSGAVKELDVYSMAVLKTDNDPSHLAHTMLFKLWSEEYIELKEESKKVLFKGTNKRALNLLPVEIEFLNSFSNPTSFKQWITKKHNLDMFRTFGRQLKEQLTEMQLVKSNERLGNEKVLRRIIYTLMLSLGLIKFFMGITYNKPVGYLVFEIIFLTILFFILNRIPQITLAGQAYLREKSEAVEYIKNHRGNRGSKLPGKEAVAAVALFGITSMYGLPEYGMIARAAQPHNISGGSGYSCSSSGCSSSGCSGGGCGGGGCGGCGGS
ncbi:MAG: TIGR04222 domain-containing membrane protein [Clostridia bacterium]|nr:TIGR04222 domain-containing membrane protein [Clostridia bacterium]